MSNKANSAKTSKIFAQVKVSVDPDVSSAFRAACAKSHVSMAEILSAYMAKYSNATLRRKEENVTRRQRRASVKKIVQQLEKIKCAEERCRDAIPENLSGSVVYETADEIISLLEEAIDLLNSAY